MNGLLATAAALRENADAYHAGLSLGGKIVLYANKGCTEQLRAQRGISLRPTKRETVGEIESRSVHDWVACSCGAIFVDGGREYIRHGGKLEMIEDRSEYAPVPEPR